MSLRKKWKNFLIANNLKILSNNSRRITHIMKSNNDMINSVMYEVNEFEEKKKHRRKKLCISIGVFVSLLICFGFIITKAIV